MSAAKKSKRLSAQELSKAIGRSTRQITEYVLRGMPKNDDGTYDLDAVVAWIPANITIRGRAAQVGGTVADSVAPADEAANRSYWETKKVEFQARREELKCKADEGTLWDRYTVQRANSAIAVRLRTRLLALGGRVSQLVPAEIKAATKRVVENEVAKTLKEAYEADIVGTTLEQMILDEADRIRAERSGGGDMGAA